MKKIIALLMFLGMIICLIIGEYQAEAFEAKAFKVVDGDSLETGDERIRILNIDAPEYMQYCYDADGAKYMCGQKAAEYMRSKMNTSVRCERFGQDRYGRTLAECYQSDGVNIGRQMVLDGWAVAYGDAYLQEESSARENKRGIWNGKFMRPELFRALEKSRKKGRK